MAKKDPTDNELQKLGRLIVDFIKKNCVLTIAPDMGRNSYLVIYNCPGNKERVGGHFHISADYSELQALEKLNNALERIFNEIPELDDSNVLPNLLATIPTLESSSGVKNKEQDLPHKPRGKNSRGSGSKR